MKPLIPVMCLVAICAAAALVIVPAAAGNPGGGEPGGSATGLLYDRVLPLSHVETCEGSAGSDPVNLGRWKQIYSEMYRASLAEPAWPDLGQIVEGARQFTAAGIFPIAILDFRYDAAVPGPGEGFSYVERRAFAATALKEYTYRGGHVVFRIDRGSYFTNGRLPDALEIDFADGLGFRRGESGWDAWCCPVAYGSPGRKTIRVRAIFGDGTVLNASFYFQVRSLATPAPDDTLAITAAIPYQGQYGTGLAYVYLSDSHSALTDPVVVVEGFDLDNTMNWEELYALLNQQGLVESLRTDGYDAVVLNFTEATDYIQKNAFVVVELIQQVKATVGPGCDMVVIGASMGGLCARYALAYMETNGLDHKARAFISFDSPHTGANIPLGVQYWTQFFSSQSEDAAYLLSRLNTPAARQMLVYHLTDPPGTTGQPDPMRAVFLADLAAAGDFPGDLRKVAVANGSGTGMDQGFAPGEQIIFYEYYSFLVDIKGNVWAVPQGTSHIILEGLIDMIWPLPDTQLNVTVSGTLPYDSAPGGWRASMATMDSTEAPYGDIVALHDAHCFIPTVSALAIDTQDLFYDVAGDSDLLAHTPFDTVYFPAANQEHVTITPESAVWFRDEIERGADSDVALDPTPGEHGGLVCKAFPNPFMSSTAVGYVVARTQRVRIEVVDTAGRWVVGLRDGMAAAGPGTAMWDGRDARGRRVGPGIYFCRMTTEDGCLTRPLVVLR